MSITSIAEPFVNLGQGLVEDILGPGQSLLGSGQGYNVFTPVITFTPFLIGLIALQFLIAFWFPTYKGVYNQENYSTFATNLLKFRKILYIVLSIASAVFVWIPLLHEAFYSLKTGRMTSVYYHAFDILLTALLLGGMFFLLSAFTKFDYEGLGGSLQFYYCASDPASKDTLDDEKDTCKRTRWQTTRDALLSGMAYYFGSLLSPILESGIGGSLMYVVLASAFLAALR